MQKFTPNYGKHDCDVTSTNSDPSEITSVENYDFIMNMTKQSREYNFGKQRIGPEPSTVDKAQQKHTVLNSYIVTHTITKNDKGL